MLQKTLYAFILFIYFLPLKGAENQDLCEVKINLQRVKKSSFKVSYFPNSEFSDKAISFPKLDRQNYFYLKPQAFISNPKAYDKNGKKVKVMSEGDWFAPNGEVYYWEFEINTSKHPFQICLASQNYFKKNYSFFINPSIFYPHHEIDRDTVMFSIRNHISQDSVIFDKYIFSNPSKLYDFSYGVSKKNIPLNDSLRSFEFLIHKKKLSFKDSELGLILNNVVKAFKNSTGIQLPDTFQFHIIVLEESDFHKNKLSKSSVYSNGISIVVNEKSNEFEQKEHIIKESIWQLYKWISPLNAHDFNLEHDSLQQQKHSIHLWYYESITRYLSIQTLLKNKLISENFFVEMFQNKMINSLNNPSYSLIQLGKEFHNQHGYYKIKRNTEVYNVFMNRGVMAAFFLDIILQNETRSSKSLLHKFLEIYEKHKNEPFVQKSFLNEFVQGESARFKMIIEKYIIGIEKLDYNAYFNLIDWQFFRKGEVHKSFIKGGHLTYFPEINRYVCTGPGKNTLGLEKGDVILSINNNQKISQINLEEIIMPNDNIRNENRVKLEIIRKGNVMVLRGKAEYSRKVKHNVIIPLYNPMSPGYKLRRNLFY